MTRIRPAHALWASLTIACLLTACGGGGDSSSAPPPPAPAPSPTTHAVSVRVDTALAAGESFAFSLGAQSASVTASGTAVAFGQGVAEGAAYTVSQTSGPRTCTLSSNRSGTMGTANVLVTASCGNPPGSSPVTGELRAPVGTQVTLRNNGGNDQALVMAALPGSSDAYNAQSFSFSAPLTDGSAYAVSLATTPSNQTCSVYKGATGTVPVAATAIKVGCEFTWDLVSRSTSNASLATRVESWKPAIGGAAGAVGQTSVGYGEGRFVVFSSAATGLSPNGLRQVFWRDRLTGETRLISANAAGAAGDGNSDRAAISADGLVVVFESAATNLVAGDNNGVRDVFLWAANGIGVAVPTQTLQRISVGPGGVEGNAASYGAVVSGDGRVVAFTTEASNIIGVNTGGSVIRRDLVAGTNTVVSTSTAGTPVGTSERAAISEDGNRIAFWSYAANIVAGDTNGMWDIFVYQHDTGSKRRVSLRADGGERNQGSDSISGVRQPVISGNGRFVAYATGSTNVVPGDTNGVDDIFIVDLDGVLPVRRLSQSGSGAQGDAQSGNGFYWESLALSYDGTWAAFVSDATNFGASAGGRNVFLRNLMTGQTRALTNATQGVDEVSISRDAAYVALGAGNPLDSRYASSGQFVTFTGIGRAWWWID